MLRFLRKLALFLLPLVFGWSLWVSTSHPVAGVAAVASALAWAVIGETGRHPAAPAGKRQRIDWPAVYRMEREIWGRTFGHAGAAPETVTFPAVTAARLWQPMPLAAPAPEWNFAGGPRPGACDCRLCRGVFPHPPGYPRQEWDTGQPPRIVSGPALVYCKPGAALDGGHPARTVCSHGDTKAPCGWDRWCLEDGGHEGPHTGQEERCRCGLKPAALPLGDVVPAGGMRVWIGTRQPHDPVRLPVRPAHPSLPRVDFAFAGDSVCGVIPGEPSADPLAPLWPLEANQVAAIRIPPGMTEVRECHIRYLMR